MQIKVRVKSDVGIQKLVDNADLLSNAQSPLMKYRSMQELYSLTGLHNVKDIIYQVQAYVRIQKIRCEQNMQADPIVLHTVFKGNPGTGKTTVARLLSKLYHEMGILSQGHTIEIERADIVGEYIGHTAQKTREQIKKALGGVLFIDEAYSLCRGGEKDFGREAIDVLVKAMEDHKNDFVLILAGYDSEMNDFLLCNPGLNSRLPIQLDFPDYSISELMNIASQMYLQREYKLDASGSELLRANLEKAVKWTGSAFGNARVVRNIMEASLRMQAVRLINSGNYYNTDLLQNISYEDINKACHSVLKNNMGGNYGY